MSKIFKAQDIIFDNKIISIDSGRESEEKITTSQINIKDNTVTNHDEKQQQKNIHFTESARAKSNEIIALAKNEAEQIIKNAYKKAEQITKDEQVKINQEAKNILREANEKGFSEGFEEGVTEANNLKEEAQKIYESAKLEKNELAKELEPEIINLVSLCVEKIINAKLSINPQIINNIINKGLNESTLTGDVYIRVSGEFYNTVIQNKDDILSKIDGSSNIEIIKDLSFVGADCVIETPFGNIDCSLDEQLNVLKESLNSIM